MPRLQTLLQRLPQLEITQPAFPPLEESRLFPKLPIELRRMIIAFAAHEPRKIMIGFESGVQKEMYPILSYGAPLQQSTTPAILHVTAEFRREGLRYYTQCESNDALTLWKQLPYSQDRLVPLFYANFDVDRFELAGNPSHMGPQDQPPEANGHKVLQVNMIKGSEGSVLETARVAKKGKKMVKRFRSDLGDEAGHSESLPTMNMKLTWASYFVSSERDAHPVECGSLGDMSDY
ncbi:uncharacterized protein RCO7_07094 [Rhynchosporium graminicola]|uniref:2EXR domain-containing protein n=1 Tax=Rhynchosporium graminicola TaxID=2792576 RepID=A0A1E1JZZ1_9HELO|nr:uncharacterized protein RCO7_07094 [Rhynchosporium commune]